MAVMASLQTEVMFSKRPVSLNLQLAGGSKTVVLYLDTLEGLVVVVVPLMAVALVPAGNS
jgi:hypothetical protein